MPQIMIKDILILEQKKTQHENKQMQRENFC